MLGTLFHFPHHSPDRQEGTASIAQDCLARTQNCTISTSHITSARETGNPNNQRIIGMATPSYTIVFSRPTSDPKDRMGQSSPPLGFTRVIGDFGTTVSQFLHYQFLERHRGHVGLRMRSHSTRDVIASGRWAVCQAIGCWTSRSQR